MTNQGDAQLHHLLQHRRHQGRRQSDVIVQLHCGKENIHSIGDNRYIVRFKVNDKDYGCVCACLCFFSFVLFFISLYCLLD
jgi:hypothetical protein